MATPLYRYRVARLLEMANMRTRIATDLHDDIGANLTRIALLSETASRHAGRRTAGVDRPHRARIVGSMSDIVWAINPKRESLLDLIAGCDSTPTKFSPSAASMHFTAPDAADARKLSVTSVGICC